MDKLKTQDKKKIVTAENMPCVRIGTQGIKHNLKLADIEYNPREHTQQKHQ